MNKIENINFTKLFLSITGVFKLILIKNKKTIN